MKILSAIGALFLGVVLAASVPANAREKEPIRLVVGFAPGGTTDVVSRVLAEALQAELGRVVLVENRPGVGGRLAGEALKNAAPDGGTFLVGPDGWAVFQTLLYPPATLKYDFLKDFVPVARIVSYPLALVAGKRTEASNAKEFANWIKGHPGEAFYGSAAAGSQTQFIGTLLGEAMGMPLTVVPYKGNSPLVTDLLGGQVPAGILVLGDAMKYRDERVRVVGILTEKRWSLTPDIPTLREQGYDVTAGMAWQAIWAPAKTPKAEINRMESALKKVLSMQSVQDRLRTSVVVTPDFASGADLDQQLRASLSFWEPIIKKSGFKPN